MHRRSLTSTGLLAATAGLVLLAGPSAHAQSADGCDAMNDPVYDRQAPFESVSGSFEAGDEITIDGSTPSSGTVTGLQLRVDSITVTTTSFPGTLSYTFPSDVADAIVLWESVGTSPSVTWSVSCASASAPTTAAPTTTAPTTTAAPTTTGDVATTAPAGDPDTPDTTTAAGAGAGGAAGGGSLPATGPDSTTTQALVAVGVLLLGVLATLAAKRPSPRRQTGV